MVLFLSARQKDPSVQSANTQLNMLKLNMLGIFFFFFEFIDG